MDGQVYLGRKGERPRALRAVEETRGEALFHDGEVIAAFYHSSCGGRTEDAGVLWGIDAPYLRGVDCDCQEISAYGLWEKRFGVAEVLKVLRREGYRVAAIDAVESGMVTPGGRVREVLFSHPGGRVSVPSEALRMSLGYSRVPSIFFEPELAEREVVILRQGAGPRRGAVPVGRRGACAGGDTTTDRSCSTITNTDNEYRRAERSSAIRCRYSL